VLAKKAQICHNSPTIARLQTGAHFRKYLQERVQVEFDGVDQSDGLIAEARDEATELVDEAATIGNLLTLHGYGLKLEGDEAHAIGLFFDPEEGGTPVKAEIIAVNEPRTLKVIVPALEAGKAYRLKVVTQSSARNGAAVLKNTREMKSDFTLAAQ
jgi:phosphosulfolactate synthase (CoM biosynthesis protein A)